MNKKGQGASAGVIVMLVRVLIGGLILFGIIYGVNQYLQSRSPIQVCKISAYASGFGKVKELAGLNCPKNIKEITFKETLPTGDLSREDKINRIIADEMVECWNKLGEGSLKPFASSWAFTSDEQIGVGVADSFCVVCSELTYEDSLQDEIGIINNFDSFIKNKKSANDVKYWDYLYPRKSGTHADIFNAMYESINFPTFLTDRKMVVYYAALKPSALAQLYTALNMNNWFSGKTSLPEVSLVSVRPINGLPKCSKWVNQAPRRTALA